MQTRLRAHVEEAHEVHGLGGHLVVADEVSFNLLRRLLINFRAVGSGTDVLLLASSCDDKSYSNEVLLKNQHIRAPGYYGSCSSFWVEGASGKASSRAAAGHTRYLQKQPL